MPHMLAVVEAPEDILEEVVMVVIGVVVPVIHVYCPAVLDMVEVVEVVVATVWAMAAAAAELVY